MSGLEVVMIVIVSFIVWCFVVFLTGLLFGCGFHMTTGSLEIKRRRSRYVETDNVDYD